MGRSGYDVSGAAPGSAAHNASLRARARRAGSSTTKENMKSPSTSSIPCVPETKPNDPVKGLADIDATPRASKMNPPGSQAAQPGAGMSTRELGSPSAPRAAKIAPQHSQNMGQVLNQIHPQPAQTGSYQGNPQGFRGGSGPNVGHGMPGMGPGNFFMPQVDCGPAIPSAVAAGYRPVIPDEVSIFTNSRVNAASSTTGYAPAAFNYNAPNAAANRVSYPEQQTVFPTMPATPAVPAPTPVEQTGDLPAIKEEPTEEVDMADSGAWPGHAPNQSYGNWGPNQG